MFYTDNILKYPQIIGMQKQLYGSAQTSEHLFPFNPIISDLTVAQNWSLFWMDD